MLAGCVQPSMMPNINSATARVLDAAGIQTVIAPEAGCCGAVKFHLNDQEGGKAQMRANIDAWWPQVERGAVEAIVMNASGCGVTVREYGHMLQGRPGLRRKGRAHQRADARPERAAARPGAGAEGRACRRRPAWSPTTRPARCSTARSCAAASRCNLRALGFDVQVARNESHLCCGSAGTYSVLQPELAYPLRDRKLGHLNQLQPTAIVSANIGCITHLQSGSADAGAALGRAARRGAGGLIGTALTAHSIEGAVRRPARRAPRQHAGVFLSGRIRHACLVLANLAARRRAVRLRRCALGRRPGPDPGRHAGHEGRRAPAATSAAASAPTNRSRCAPP